MVFRFTMPNYSGGNGANRHAGLLVALTSSGVGVEESAYFADSSNVTSYVRVKGRSVDATLKRLRKVFEWVNCIGAVGIYHHTSDTIPTYHPS